MRKIEGLWVGKRGIGLKVGKGIGLGGKGDSVKGGKRGIGLEVEKG